MRTVKLFVSVYVLTLSALLMAISGYFLYVCLNFEGEPDQTSNVIANFLVFSAALTALIECAGWVRRHLPSAPIAKESQ